MNRYGVSVAFWITAVDEDAARVVVGNFVDSFPESVNGEFAVYDGDVMVQDVELEDTGVEVEVDE